MSSKLQYPIKPVVGVDVNVGVGVLVAVYVTWVGVLVIVGVLVRVGEFEGVSVFDEVGVFVCEPFRVGVKEGVRVNVEVGVGNGVLEGMLVGVEVAKGVAVAVVLSSRYGFNCNAANSALAALAPGSRLKAISDPCPITAACEPGPTQRMSPSLS
jgi:hypothetical protein